MKKTYIAPEAHIECRFAEVMQLPVESVGQKGSVSGQTDTNWEFGGTPNEEDGPLNPTAKKGFWDDDYEE